MIAGDTYHHRFLFSRRTWTEIHRLDRARTILLLPVGSTEAHGPHLPLSTDVIISEEMCLRAARRLEEQGSASLVLPSMCHSVTDFGADFPGSISIQPSTATALLQDLLRSLISQGFRWICVANSHLEPVHVACIDAAIEAIREETDIRIAFPDIRRRRWAEMLTKEFMDGECHAGQFETSLILAAASETVREIVLRRLPRVAISLSEAIRNQVASFREAGGNEAYFGDPARATVEEGEAMFEVLANILIISLRETYPEIGNQSA